MEIHFCRCAVKSDLLRLKLLNWYKHTEKSSVKNRSENGFNPKEIILNSRDEEFLKKAVKEVTRILETLTLIWKSLVRFCFYHPIKFIGK